MPAVSRRSRRTLLASIALALTITSACANEQGVSTIAAEQSPALAPAPPDTQPPSTSAPGDTQPPTSSSPATEPPVDPSLPAISEPELFVDIPIDQVVDVDGNKPARDYDAFVGTALADLERWWGEVYPAVYGEPFEPLAGGVYAGYPERATDVPGCGEEQTPYADLNLYVAFYCDFSDFMAYDDGDDSLLAPLANEFGPAVLGVVLAHEYGHAIQSRTGALERFLATIYTEQQADCFSGAWAGQAYRGESPLLRLGDVDLRAGLVAILEVRDPVGTDQFVAGGHGSAFDRVGAFQEGFVNGPERCAELLDQPLVLMPNQFQPTASGEVSLDEILQGNAPYDCEELRALGADDAAVADCTPAPTFLAEDLNDFWSTELGSEFPAMSHAPTSDVDSFGCSDGVRLALEVLLCPSQDSVVYDEPDVISLYRAFGDFTLGYFYGIAWAERAQELLASPLQGEQRALLNDCYTGAWVSDITPDATGQTNRPGEDAISSSPGDLDEAIRMAIILGDAGAQVNQVGSPFEKIESFRAGVLGGLDACNTRFGV
jgi:predicted metalloprotease